MTPNIRTLPSGRHQVRFRYKGVEHVSPHTFRTKADAVAWRDNELSELRKGTWIDPRGGQTTVAAFAASWLAGRDLAERTAELYQQLLRDHINPRFGKKSLASVTPGQVRSWYGELPARIVARELERAHPRSIDGRTAAAKAYRLLATIMRAAVADELISRSPCRLPGAAKEEAAERETVTVDEADALAWALPERYRIVVDLIMWCQLRQGEWMRLQRSSLDLKRGTLEVRRSRVKKMDGTMLEKDPKSDAGKRVIFVPPNALFPLRKHVERFVGPELEAYVVTGERGGPLHPGTWYKAWATAKAAIGRPDLRPHDLRHSGLTLLAQYGATTKELMHRAGHASSEAALRYQHATLERDRQLALELANADPSWHVVGTEPAHPSSRGHLRRVK